VKNNKKLTRYSKNKDAEVFEESISHDISKKIARYCYTQQTIFKKNDDKNFQTVIEQISEEAYKYLRRRN